MNKVGLKVSAVLVAGVMSTAFSACSFSASSRSSSRSSSSSCRSSSRHGDAKEEIEKAETGFQEEIAAIAVLYVGSGGSAEDFQRDVSAAAKRNGIPYWELDERIFTAIGIGLQRAGVEREAVPSLPFLQYVKNAPHFNAIRNAYGKGN